MFSSSELRYTHLKKAKSFSSSSRWQSELATRLVISLQLKIYSPFQEICGAKIQRLNPTKIRAVLCEVKLVVKVEPYC